MSWLLVRYGYQELVRRDMGGGEMQIFVPRWNLNCRWMRVTKESWGLNAGAAGPGWRGDVNLCTLLEEFAPWTEFTQVF